MTAAVIEMVERLAKEDGINRLALHGKDGQLFYDSTWIAGVDYTKDFYDDIYQDPDYEDKEQQDIDLEADDAISQGEMEYLEAGIQDGSEDLSKGTTSIQDEIEDDENADKALYEVTEEADDFIEEYVLNDQAYTLNHQSSEDSVSSEDVDQVDQDPDNEDEQEVAKEEEPLGLRRSTRMPSVSERLQSYRQQTGKNYNQYMTEILSYTLADARVLATIMIHVRDAPSIHATQHVITYSLKQGIAKYGEAARQAAMKEMKQLHDRECFMPIDPKTMSTTEKKRVLESLIFLTEKKDGLIKGRHCANGNPQRQWMDREQVSSPTVMTESTMITAIIEAKENRDVATCDIPNAFIQTEVEKHDKDGHRTIMKIRGPLVEILCEMDPNYREFVVSENNRQVLYVHIIKALYGLMVSAMLFYNKLKNDLIKIGFKLNSYDPCVANKMVNGNQLTVSWHVDDLKVSHKDSKAVDEFLEWVRKTYGTIGKVKEKRGKIHEYLGMKLDYTHKGKVIIDMIEYVESMVKSFPEKDLQGIKVKTPWNDNLFKVKDKSPKLPRTRAERFHTVTAQGLFLCKRGRPDISPAIAYLTTRVRSPNEDDWEKLMRMIQYLKHTKNDRLTLESDESMVVNWHVDASFAVHPDMRSHTGISVTFGKGFPINISRKQSINTRSSTEAELVAADDAMGPILWTKHFLAEQGYNYKQVLHQDNKSAMLLESNGRKSAGKRSRHINIRYFFISDMKEKGQLSIRYCPTDKLVADYMTKPLHGSKFKEFRQQIMNLSTSTIG